MADIEIPSKIERDIDKFAQERHITRDEAVLQLIEAGLSVRRAGAKAVFEQGLGLFGAPADASLLDEVVAIAYEERRRPTN